MIHNKVSSEKFYNEINTETGYIWEDVSWGNDECDSIFCKNLDMQIFFPNEDYPTFLIVLDCTLGSTSDRIEYGSIVEVIEFINNIKN
jgi:hypothetical protein